MRPALRFLPASTSPGRNLALATAVVAAAGIAAVTAPSAEDGGGAVMSAAPDRSAGDVAGSPPAAHDPAARGGGSPLADAPIGDVERLSDRQQLPSLSADGRTVDDDSLGGTVEPDAAGPDEGSDADAAGPDEGSDEESDADAEPVYETVDGEQIDAARVFAFLDGRDAPLARHAETIVAAGVAHDVDPRVVVAIAIAESNGAEMKPAGTHNAWGWGGSGPRGLRDWGSWEESIDEYTERLGALYDTDNVDWEFASTYCPPNTQWWYDTVTWAIDRI